VWLVSESDGNPYNEATREILKSFAGVGISASGGNVIFPAGNALRCLAEYFPQGETLDLSAPCGAMPYTSRLDRLESLSIEADGEVRLCCSLSVGNVCEEDILPIIDRYDPRGRPELAALTNGGVAALIAYAARRGVA
jgi:hypothetical protein